MIDFFIQKNSKDSNTVTIEKPQDMTDIITLSGDNFGDAINRRMELIKTINNEVDMSELNLSISDDDKHKSEYSLSSLDLSRYNYIKFQKCNLKNLNLSNKDIYNVDFTESNLNSVNFNSSNFKTVILDSTKQVDTSFNNAFLQDVSLRKVIGYNVDMSYAIYTYTDQIDNPHFSNMSRYTDLSENSYYPFSKWDKSQIPDRLTCLKKFSNSKLLKN